MTEAPFCYKINFLSSIVKKRLMEDFNMNPSQVGNDKWFEAAKEAGLFIDNSSEYFNDLYTIKNKLTNKEYCSKEELSRLVDCVDYLILYVKGRV